MSNTKHTPGPWSVDGFNTTAVIAAMSNGGWQHVCNCNYGYAEPEKHIELNKANAKLIAAAPDLLAYIIELKERFAACGHINDVADCERIIKKATE